MLIGEKIKEEREKRGYSQKQLAPLLSLSVGCLSKYETGKCHIPLDVLLKLCEVYSVSLDYLVGRSEAGIDCKTLSSEYSGNLTFERLISDAQSLDKKKRRILSSVLYALKCQNEMEKYKSNQ